MKEEYVPYAPDIVGPEMIYLESVFLETGSQVSVGRSKTHPQGDSFVHKFRTTRPDGTKTELKFTLSIEACRAMVVLYAEQGLFDPYNITNPPSEHPPKE